MKKFITLFSVMISAFLLIIAETPAKAVSLGPIGPPVITGSWTQTWLLLTTVDKLEAFIVSGNTDFEIPGMTNFSAAGWSATRINPDYSLATGPSASNFTFDETFTASVSEPIVVDFLFWLAGSFNIGIRQSWDGTSWIFVKDITNPSGYDRASRASVPEPSTLLLLGSGLVGLGYFSKKRFLG